jgi:hypothetical protein
VGFEPCQPKLKHGEQTHGAYANNHYVGGSLVGLHRSPAEKWSALIWECNENPFPQEGNRPEKEKNGFC